MNHPRQARPRGVILLIVLGILALLSVLAVSFVQLSQLESAISTNYVNRTRALLVAESGVEYAIARLSSMELPLTADMIESLRYQEHPSRPGLAFAQKPSLNMAAPDDAWSGVLGSSVAPDGDRFKLRIADESGKLNLNDSNGLWNIDTDPLADSDVLGAGDDLDVLNSLPRLEKLFEDLVERLWGGGLPGIGANASIALFNYRDQLPGKRFINWDQVREALVDPIDFTIDNPLSAAKVEVLKEYVTIWGWQDPNVLRPTFRLEISSPAARPQPSDQFNIYLYSDFQTKYYELEPRCPVNINVARPELIEALIAPVQGWYLYEGEPNIYMTGSTGPWVKAMRATTNSWVDRDRKNGFPGSPICPWTFGGIPRMSSEGNYRLGEGTRYGEALLTRPIDSWIVTDIAKRMYMRIHDPYSPQPFRTWDEFTRFIYELVDTSVDNAQGLRDFPIPSPLRPGLQPNEGFLPANEESQRFPYHLDGTDSSYILTQTLISGFDRYQADALLANFNPNAMLNDFNPDAHLFRHVDKAQLTAYTTELCFQPTGYFQIESHGAVLDASGLELSSVGIRSAVQVFHTLRLTSQEQFMQSSDAATSYDIDRPDSLYDLFYEARGGTYPLSSADLEMARYSGSSTASGGGHFLSTGRMGPSLMSFPEPIRNANSLSMTQQPEYTPSQFSRYDGGIMLNTIQKDAGSYPLDRAGSECDFMAPMGYRWLPPVSRGSTWRDRSLAVGGMLPVRLGNNDETNPQEGSTYTTDNIATMDVPGGRAVMLAWDDDYTTLSDLTNPDPFVFLLNPVAGPNPAWRHDAPWLRRTFWKDTRVAYFDHFWSMLSISPVAPYVESSGTYSPLPGNALFKLGMNMPSDMPLTPDARDTSGAPQPQVPGNLYADGAFSEAGRGLGYPATNLGSCGPCTIPYSSPSLTYSDWNRHYKGAVSFWVKPHWDAGYSNRIRQLFSVGHLGSMFTHALDLLYFPDNRRGGDEVTVKHPINMGHCPWLPLDPFPTHSFMFGWYSNSNFVNASGVAYENWDSGSVMVSPAATDFFPYRVTGQRLMNPAPAGFYGHQWNLIGMSFLNPYLQGNTRTNGAIVEYSINGMPISEAGVAQLQGGDHLQMGTGTAFPNLAGELHWFWEEGHAHQDIFSSSWEPTPVPETEMLHIGESYMRFGWCEENNGPTGDSTYDEIVCWDNPVSLSAFNSMWLDGRYSGESLEHLHSGSRARNVAGLYTSPRIDVFRALSHDLNARNVRRLSLHSVSWTQWWPRYNWRPGGGDIAPSNPMQYKNWGTVGFDGVHGVDVHAGLPPQATPQNDPVLGARDCVTLDVLGGDGERWICSGDLESDPGHTNVFSNDEKTLACPAGSLVPNGAVSIDRTGSLRFRAYFHLEDGSNLLESPVLDDLTFVFLSDRPMIIHWQTVSN